MLSLQMSAVKEICKTDYILNVFMSHKFVCLVHAILN
jgi:hypothetical protein